MGAGYSPNITKNGLIWFVDTANPRSYRGTNKTWYDLKEGADVALFSANHTTDYMGGITFNGASDYGVVQGSQGFSLASTGGTIAGVISYTSIPTNNTGWFSKRITDSSIPYHMGQPNGTTKLRLIANNNTTLVELDSNTQIGLNTPAIFAASFATNGDYKIYINGDLDNSRSGAVTLINNDASIVVADNGANSTPVGGNQNTDCVIYSLQLYNRVLSPSEVKQNYNAIKSRFR